MALHNRHQQTNILQPTPRPSKRILSKREKVLHAIVNVGKLLSVTNLNAQSVKIQNIKHKIDETKKQNVELTFEVSELSTYGGIWKKEKEFNLKLKEKNVKVVSEQ